MHVEGIFAYPEHCNAATVLIGRLDYATSLLVVFAILPGWGTVITGRILAVQRTIHLRTGVVVVLLHSTPTQ